MGVCENEDMEILETGSCTHDLSKWLHIYSLTHHIYACLNRSQSLNADWNLEKMKITQTKLQKQYEQTVHSLLSCFTLHCLGHTQQGKHKRIHHQASMDFETSQVHREMLCVCLLITGFCPWFQSSLGGTLTQLWLTQLWATNFT